jgi:hypothetical protein
MGAIRNRVVPICVVLRDGTKKEPKFERGNLESQSSGNQLKGNPEVLSRLGHQAGSKETTVSAAILQSAEWVKPERA